MLHLLLLILKIIGIILLAVLGLILFLLLVLLLVPVRYRAKGSYYGKPEGILKVTWLCHMVSVKLSYREKTELIVRILGIRLFKEKGKKAEETLEEEPILAASDLAEELTDPEAEEELVEDPKIAEEHRALEEEKRLLTEEKDRLSEEQPGGRSAEKGLFRRLIDRVCLLFRRIKLACRMAAARIRMAADKKEELAAFLNDEKNRETFRLMKRLAFKAFRHILPRKLKGELTFGVEDPYRMGQILTGAAIFYPMYQNSLTLTPVFEQNLFEGRASLKGHIRPGTLALIGFRLIMHKNFRVLLKKFLAQGGN